MLRNILGALAFTVGFAFAQHAAALTIHAELTSFQNANRNLSGVVNGSGGGRGTFNVVGGDSLAGTQFEDLLVDGFQGICLEPTEYVSVGNTYVFDIVDLAAAPTARPGGMGPVRATWVEKAADLFDWGTVNDITGSTELSLAQGLAWEAAYETGLTMSRTGGGSTSTGIAAADVLFDAGTLDINAVSSLGGNVNAWALLNVGQLGRQSRSIYRGQDFVVWDTQSVPTPGPLALVGLGLLGLGFIRKIGENA